MHFANSQMQPRRRRHFCSAAVQKRVRATGRASFKRMSALVCRSAANFVQKCTMLDGMALTGDGGGGRRRRALQFQAQHEFATSPFALGSSDTTLPLEIDGDMQLL